MTVYNVYHVYDVDGGFGDAVYAENYVAHLKRKQMQRHLCKNTVSLMFTRSLMKNCTAMILL